MFKILIIEDAAVLREAYQAILTKEGFEVITAAGANEALAAAERLAPDLILLDILMPEVNGLEFLRQYRATHGRSGAAIVVFSNMDNAGIQEEAEKLGITRYLMKSLISTQELVEIVNDCLTPATA